jgi:dihydrofolate reductase
MKAIVAMAENRVIGAAGCIPWHLPEDFRFFKRTTMGHPILMGRKTYDSIGKPLPGRQNIVLTRQKVEIPGVTVIHNRESLARIFYTPSACHKSQQIGHEISGIEQLFIIGGAEIYKLLLPECKELFITHILKKVEGDTFFPPFEKEFDEGNVVLETADFVTKHYCRVKILNHFF